MKDQPKPENRDRRNFLKAASLAAPAVTAGVLSAGKAKAEPHDETASKGRGLRKTAHVQAYLDSARF